MKNAAAKSVKAGSIIVGLILAAKIADHLYKRRIHQDLPDLEPSLNGGMSGDPAQQRLDSILTEEETS